MSGKFYLIFLEVRERERAAVPAARKPAMSEEAGHQSGLRVSVRSLSRTTERS